MDFTYIGNGPVIVSGCTKIVFRKRYSFDFAIGSKVYSIDKARHGIIEFVYIKKVIVRKNKYGQRVILYVDTLNALWNQSDLCNHATALALAIAYLEELEEKGAEAIRIVCNRQQCHSTTDQDVVIIN